MRVEIEVAGVPRAAPAEVRPRPLPVAPPLRRRPDWFELLVLGALAAVSVWVLGLDLYQVLAHGLVWTGTDGIYVVDQMQYLAWIQEASRHVLASNLFVLQPTAIDYFQPAVAISGALTALGVAPWLALLLWKPVAVAAAFFGVREYAHRSVSGTWPRRAVLTLGLFFGSFTVIYGSWGVIGDLFTPFLSWGYTFGLLALAVMLFALFAYERARAGLGDGAGAGATANGGVRAATALDGHAGARMAANGRVRAGTSANGHLRARTAAARGRLSWWVPGLLGALASSLHPWQGELLILIIVGTELTLWHRDRRTPQRVMLPLITVVGTGVPLAYYALLGRFDPAWHLARVASKHSFSLTTILIAVLPLLIPALFAIRPRPRTFIAIVTRIWPLAAIVIYLLSGTDASATPLHAFEGITIPLSVLAVQGLQRVGLGRVPARVGRLPAGVRRLPARRALVIAGLAVATIPATVYQLRSAKQLVAPQPRNANFITSDEQRALGFLAADPRPGGVLTRFYLGAVVPAQTGRHTYVGDCLWSQPNCTGRAQLAQTILDGSIPGFAVRAFVGDIGARFVLTDCQARPDMPAVLRPLTRALHRFGCAAVYELR
jgi:hypothetical protein